MSYFYKYNFVSPEPIYATIKEELKSYFDTGAVDDLLFPTYLNKALNKLGRSSYPIVTGTFKVEDFTFRLPDNFYAVREAWMCTEVAANSYQDASSTYVQTITLLNEYTTGPEQCEPACPPDPCDPCPCEPDPCACQTKCRPCGEKCGPEELTSVYKINNEVRRTFKKQYLLKPGNISAKSNCSVEYACFNGGGSFTPGASAPDSFDIRDNKFVTNFRSGVVNMLFYATDYDGNNNQLVPDNYRVKEYVEAFIKYKVFEILTHQITDETFNQLQQKLLFYKQAYDEAYIMADIEIKKQDIYTKVRKINSDLNRLNMYELPNRTGRYGRRR